MSKQKVNKTYEEINARIKAGEAVVVTAEEMVGIVSKEGPERRHARSMWLLPEPFRPCVHQVPLSILVIPHQH